jgi:hypothetical protein
LEGRLRDYPADPACTGIKGWRMNLALGGRPAATDGAPYRIVARESRT